MLPRLPALGASTRARGDVLLAVCLAVCLAVLLSCGHGPASADGAPGSGAAAASTGAQLSPTPAAALQVADDGPTAGYSRAAFGDGWARTAPGCDTRDLVLRRDLSATTVRHGCDVVAGTLHDPYSGRVVTGPTRALDIDHLVPLALAWRSGAAGWSPAKRAQFANDLDNLRATVASDNRSKGDQGPEAWLPPHDPCGYSAAFRAVVEHYGLTVTAPRAAALAKACQ